jgi:hypothetical protein
MSADPTDEELSAGTKKVEMVRYAFAGKVQTLFMLYALNPDCSDAMEGWEHEISKQPEHGVANIEDSTFFPTYPKNSPQYKCNEHKIHAQILTYQAKQGYKGPDSLTLLQIGPSGFAWERTWHLNVRNPTGSRNADVEVPEAVVPKPRPKKDKGA